MSLKKKLLSKPVLAGIAVVMISGSIVGWRASQASKPEPKKTDDKVVLEFTPSDIATVELKSLVNTIQFSGSLAPVTQTTVKSKVPGEVTKVTVREGQTVTQGQLIAQIDTLDLQAKLDAQAAALAESRAKLDIALKNRENNQQLLRQKFISQNAYDTTQSVYEAADANMRSAEAQLRMAQKAIGDAEIHAPFAGIVAKKIVNAGEKVGVDSPLFQLVDLGIMEIEAPAPASEVPAVRVGQAVTFRVDGFGERAFEGRVERINPMTEQGSRSITLYISVTNRDGVLRGKRAVKVGSTEAQAGLVEVKSGLETGLQVVSARVTGLKPGTPAILKAPGAKATEEAKDDAKRKQG